MRATENINLYKTKCLMAGSESIRKAAKLIKRGEPVAFPTETVYGLGANGLDAHAVARIFEAKQRPADNPLILHISGISELQRLCHPNQNAFLVAEAFWPGPLTILLNKKDIVPSIVTADLNTVAVRMPAHQIALELIRQSGCPIAAPSANRSGRPSPTRAAHVMEDMQGRIPMVLDGGPCEIGLESTVLDLSLDTPVILRPGGITLEMLKEVLPNAVLSESVMRPLHAGESAPSPGMRHKHYAPAGNIILIQGNPESVAQKCRELYNIAIVNRKKACILAISEHLGYYNDCRAIDLGSLDHPEVIANRLFDVLRQTDEEHIEAIFCEMIPAEGLGLAIMNRLGRAASFQIINV